VAFLGHGTLSYYSFEVIIRGELCSKALRGNSFLVLLPTSWLYLALVSGRRQIVASWVFVGSTEGNSQKG
jgi:hypothetical protein